MEKSTQVDLNLFRTFLAVCESGKIALAARRLSLSQPAVTAKIRKLEGEVGAELFRRSVKGVELTPAGLRLREDVSAILAAVDQALRKTSGRTLSGRLQIAASTTFASYLFPELYRGFQGCHPELGVSLWSANTEEVLTRVGSGKARLGVVEGLPRASGLRLEPFLADELIFVAAPRVAAGITRTSQLAEQSILWRESGSGTRAVIQRALAEKGLGHLGRRAKVELGSTEAIKGYASTGAGVAILPSCSLKREFALNLLVPVLESQFRIERKFSWVLGSGALDPAHALFKAYVEANGSR